MDITTTTETVVSLTIQELITAAQEDGEALSVRGTPTKIRIDGKDIDLTALVTFSLIYKEENPD